FTAPVRGGPAGTITGPGQRTNTVREVTVTKMAMAVGDIASFSTIAEQTDDRLLLENIDRLFTGLRRILTRHNGVLSNYVGDAFFATWESAAMVATAMDAKGMTATVHRSAAGFAFTPLPAVQVKGRRQPVEILGAERLLPGTRRNAWLRPVYHERRLCPVHQRLHPVHQPARVAQRRPLPAAQV